MYRIEVSIASEAYIGRFVKGVLSKEDAASSYYESDKIDIINTRDGKAFLWKLEGAGYQGFTFRQSLLFVPNLQETLSGLGVPVNLLDLSSKEMDIHEVTIKYVGVSIQHNY